MRLGSRLLPVVALAAVALTPVLPAQAAGTDPAVPISAKTKTITVTGHGWGHGHGMSQYGAQGAAREGLTWAQILRFYYPGTASSSFSGKVRVLITADTDHNTTVRATRGLRLTDTGRARTWTLPTSTHPRAWRLRTKDGQRQVLYLTDSWHRYHPGGHATLAGDGQFSALNGPVTLRLSTGDRAYRGVLRLTHRATVNVLGMEKYLRGVVPSEMPPSWKPAALGAQAVAARTYAAFERGDNLSRYFQVYDTTQSQVYGGYGAETDATDAAVAATAHRILTYQGEPAFTQFSASSGGWTSAGSQPYLVAKQDVYDKPVDPTTKTGDPYFDWDPSTVSLGLLRAAYGSGSLTSVQITAREAPNTPGVGHVKTVVLRGSAGRVTLDGATFSSMYGLRSTYFALAAS